MASSLLAMRKQLECPICCELFDAPKILESCNHVFCKKCVSGLAKSKGGSRFPCPQCRVQCKLPGSGVDGLKDDLVAKNLIDIIAKSDLEGTCLEKPEMCSICYELEVKSVCDLCDLALCPDCRKDHLEQTKQTGDHIVYDVCMKHKKRMKHYCYKCDAVICVKCLRTDHSDKDHGTSMYRGFATDQVKSLEVQADKISHTAKSTVDRITKADMYLVELKLKVESRKKKIIDGSNAVIQPLTCKIYNVKQEIEKLKTRLQQLESEKATRIESMEAKIKEIDNVHVDSFQVEPYKETVSEAFEELATTKDMLNELKKQNWCGVEHHQQIVACRSGMVVIESTLGELEDSMDKIELAYQIFENVELEVTPGERACKFSEHADLNFTLDEHDCESSEDAELNVTPDEHDYESSDDIQLPFPQNVESSSVEHDSALAVTAEVAKQIAENNAYAWSIPKDLPRSQSRLLREWNFDTNGPSCMYSVVCLPEGFAILGGTSDIHPSKIFYFHSMDDKAFTEVTQGVTQSKDLAANVGGDLVLLRVVQPQLRVYSVARNYQWYDSIPLKIEFTRPHSLACSGEEIIVLDGHHPNVTVFVLTAKGEVLHSLQESYHGRLACNPLNQMVYISFPGADAFKLSGSRLSPTGKILELIPRCLKVRDICCGADGIIFAAGTLKHKLSGYSYGTGSRHRVMVSSLSGDTAFIVDIGQPTCTFVDENVERIRIDIKEKTLIIGCGAKLLFYEMI